jgi:Xaa-Pro aminopeptidase
MTTFLHVADALSSPAMRHEVGEAVMDDLIFIEHDNKRIIVGTILERSIFETREDVVDEFWLIHDMGADQLVKDESFPHRHLMAEMAVRALAKLGANEVLVPPSFRLNEADYLRSKGVDLVVDDEAWAQRRRRKTPWELEGIERAQRAADTAMLTAARMLREATRTSDGQLRFEGEILTAEWIREAMSSELLTQGAESEEILVHTGDACLRGHDIGTGPILPDQSCVIDCFPRDRRTGVYTDMTRTFVPGEPSPELAKLHAHCREALALALEQAKPGSAGGHHTVVEFFHANGYPTFDHHEGEETLTHGFFHPIGHGVGLEVHERPRQGRRAEVLQEGDVIAIEPGLYFEGIGGVRLEDTVLITDTGYQHFTDPLPYEL